MGTLMGDVGDYEKKMIALPRQAVQPPAPETSPLPQGPHSAAVELAERHAARAAPGTARGFMPLLHPSTAKLLPLHAVSVSTPTAVKSHAPGAVPRNAKNYTTVFGDEFWKRFNKTAKEEKQTAATAKGGSSAFLRKYSRGAGRLSKWVWCCTILLLICITGGVGAGWYFTHKKPSGQPQAFGGSENENSLSPKVPVSTAPATPSTSASMPAVSAGAGTEVTAPVRRRRHRATR